MTANQLKGLISEVKHDLIIAKASLSQANAKKDYGAARDIAKYMAFQDGQLGVLESFKDEHKWSARRIHKQLRLTRTKIEIVTKDFNDSLHDGRPKQATIHLDQACSYLDGQEHTLEAAKAALIPPKL